MTQSGHVIQGQLTGGKKGVVTPHISEVMIDAALGGRLAFAYLCPA
jgi:hypothetical protein